MAKFRSLIGQHSGPSMVVDPETKRLANKVWEKGEVIDTYQDLMKHNAGPGSAFQKFEQISDDALPGGRILAELKPVPDQNDPANFIQNSRAMTQAEAPAPPTNLSSNPNDLDNLSVNQLRQYAKSNELTLGTANSKEEILKAIKSQLASV